MRYCKCGAELSKNKWKWCKDSCPEYKKELKHRQKNLWRGKTRNNKKVGGYDIRSLNEEQKKKLKNGEPLTLVGGVKYHRYENGLYPDFCLNCGAKIKKNICRYCPPDKNSIGRAVLRDKKVSVREKHLAGEMAVMRARGLSYNRIGKLLNKDHTTVIYHIQKLVKEETPVIIKKWIKQ